MNIFVGNLSFETEEADVYKLFMPFGSVTYVSIVMDKKGRESRGFGFLEMPDEQQAQAAIAALNHKEFMGRPINVEPARIKPEASRDSVKREKDEGRNQPKPPAFKKAAGYRGGRRTRSFMKKRAQSGITGEVKPRQQNKKNPMAWPKKHIRPKPWQRSRGEFKPWKKAEAEVNPWRESDTEAKPRKKPEGETRPWIKKGADAAKPWLKKSNKRFEKRPKAGSYKKKRGRF